MFSFLARVLNWLKNEPLIRKIGPVALLTAVVGVLGATNVLSPRVMTEVTAIIGAVGVPLAALWARLETTGPITAAGLKAQIEANPGAVAAGVAAIVVPVVEQLDPKAEPVAAAIAPAVSDIVQAVPVVDQPLKGV